MIRLNRRTVLRTAVVFSGGFAFRRIDGDLFPGADLLRRAAAQGDSPLTVAMLDVHAERLAPLIQSYADETGSGIDVTPLAYGDLYNQLSLALTQRSPKFDVVSLDDPWIPQFSSFLTPVDLPSHVSDVVVPVASALARFPADATPCGLPWLGDSQFLVTRPAWLKHVGLEAPVSWDETVANASTIATTLDSDSGLAGFAISSLSPHQIVDSFLPILRGYGKDLIDPVTSVPQLDTAAALEAVQVFQQLAAMSPAESPATGEPSNTERFQAGSVAMMSNFWASGLLGAGEVEAARNSGPVTCALQPAQQGSERRSMSGVWIAGIPVGSERPARARSFLKWLVSPDTQRAMVEVMLPPVAAPVYVDDALIDAQPHLPQLLDLLAASTPRPRTPYYAQLELLLASELSSMLAGEKTGEIAVGNANLAMREFLVREGVLVS